MELFKSRSARLISNAPGRLYRALPAVVLGTLFNVLDTVSTGLLIFPSDEGTGPTQFKALQMQGLSMYILSTVMSQVAMTCGGSRFPGALGAMLIEILPFLRGVGSDIRNALGSDNPALVPTVMAAYALTSFLTGFVFIVLGLLKLGNLVAYFPQTVLTGAIGAIGLSLFILGLGLTFPISSPQLTLASAGSLLFSRSHIPLLAASFLPAFFLSVCKRSAALDRWSRGFVHNAYFVPLYLFSIPAAFWIIVSAAHLSKDTLITHGWLFKVEAPPTTGYSAQGGSSSFVTSINYWSLFDFPKVEWWALKNAITNIVLLVVIGVLNLPIYVPALAFTLDVSYDMNHEFLGQGAANLLAGMAGTVPNILQYSYSVFVTRAGGGRFECALVTLLTFILFLTSSLLLPYVPTVLASALVLFLGIELLSEAVWEAAKTLVLLEWSVVMATLLACTFLGFAEGFGVGIATATVVYLAYGVVDSKARVTQWEEWNEMHKQNLHDNTPPPLMISPLNHTPSTAALPTFSIHAGSTHTASSKSLVQNPVDDVLSKINARVVVLNGYVFFATIPSLETNLLSPNYQTSYIIIDMTTVHRLETSAAQCFERSARDLAPRSITLVLCGVQKGSGVHADFERAGVSVVFGGEGGGEGDEKGILAFGTREESVGWCKRKNEEASALAEKGSVDGIKCLDHGDVYAEFCRLFGFDERVVFGGDGGDENVEVGSKESLAMSSFDRFVGGGGRVVRYAPGQTIARSNRNRIVFITEGQAEVVPPSGTPNRQSIRQVLLMLPKQGMLFMKERFLSRWRRRVSVMGSGDVLDCRRVGEKGDCVVARTECVVVEIEGEGTEGLMRWARGKAGEEIDS
ncbi:hypothetical protein JAAARDRAFT_57211 [Jaapia argillacea MUCL 33604]|uniref:STAS domain-containing protein n=1 Tax=Jaapia argillacea MUCL 33604 TaxID=933084 RepID=A0A067PX36_9AGAM|nr:hypothetical protein JAAARDRAFT_57211 [Jaapia argillacea MUCL 33604]